jgi:hypothetical protein
MYYNTSYESYRNLYFVTDRFKFESGIVFKHAHATCVEFYYWLVGSQPEQGTLTVGYRMNDQSYPVWTILRRQKRQWSKAQVQLLPQDRQYVIYFKADAYVGYGHSDELDMAVDDVKITQGACDSPTAGQVKTSFKLCKYSKLNINFKITEI